MPQEKIEVSLRMRKEERTYELPQSSLPEWKKSGLPIAHFSMWRAWERLNKNLANQQAA